MSANLPPMPEDRPANSSSGTAVPDRPREADGGATPLDARQKRAAFLVFGYLAVCAVASGSVLAGAFGPRLPREGGQGAGGGTVRLVALPDAVRVVTAKHCLPAAAASAPATPPAPEPSAAEPTADNPPAAARGPALSSDQPCGPSIARGLLEDAFYVLALLGILGGSLSGLWSLVMYVGYGTFRSSWVAFYLIRPLGGAVAAPSILFGLELFQLRPSSVQVCLFVSFLAAVAVQHYMKKVFDLATTLFHPRDEKSEKYVPPARGESAGPEREPAGGAVKPS